MMIDKVLRKSFKSSCLGGKPAHASTTRTDPDATCAPEPMTSPFYQSILTATAERLGINAPTVLVEEMTVAGV